MLDGGLTVLDGTHLRALDLCLSDSDVAFNGAQVLELAESKATSSLFGLLLPENLKSSALKRLDIDDAVSFRGTELDHHQALSKLNDYVTAIADELKDDPIVVSILDGHTLRLFLEDEDDFAMLAENLFTDLDTEDKGKINKREIRNALVHMGVEMGVPPFSVFPLLNDILKKHEGEGEGEEVGQAQFAELLQPVLQDLADALSEKNVVVVQNVKIINGSKLRKVLAEETQFNEVVEKIVLEKKSGKEGKKDIELIRNFLEKNGTEIGLPPSNANEAVVLLYDAAFADLVNGKDEIRVNVKEILEKFAEQLDANPVFLDLDN